MLQKIQVGAYSGFKANERPLHFAWGQERHEVRGVLERWVGPESDYFRVRADDGHVYVLKWHRVLDAWFLVKGGGGRPAVRPV